MRCGSGPRPRRTKPSSGVPPHLRDGHYQGAAKLGHGAGYRYPHDDARGWVEQEYLPPEVADETFYRPSAHGHEREVAQRMDQLHQNTSDRDRS